MGLDDTLVRCGDLSGAEGCLIRSGVGCMGFVGFVDPGALWVG